MGEGKARPSQVSQPAAPKSEGSPRAPEALQPLAGRPLGLLLPVLPVGLPVTSPWEPAGSLRPTPSSASLRFWKA